MSDSIAGIKRQASILLEEEDFSGSILLAQDNRLLLKESYGMANYELGAVNSAETKYRIGSITKLFTATAIMQLAEKGQLSLEWTLGRFIADYPKGDQVKVLHLLNHTSGIKNLTELPDFLEWVRVPSSVPQTVDRFKGKPFDFHPGENYKYSNSNYILLTYIVERLTGQSYEAYITRNIFRPSKMLNTCIDNQEAIIHNRAAGYNIEDGKLMNAPYIHMGNTAGAASALSTTEDLFLFIQAFFNGTLVQQKTVERMLEPGLGEHGLGWMVGQKKGQKIAYHGGGIHGFSANLLKNVETDISMIILSNVFYPKEKIEAISSKLTDLF